MTLKNELLGGGGGLWGHAPPPPPTPRNILIFAISKIDSKAIWSHFMLPKTIFAVLTIFAVEHKTHNTLKKSNSVLMAGYEDTKAPGHHK